MTNIERLAMRFNRLEGGAPSIEELDAILSALVMDEVLPAKEGETE